MKVKFVLIGVIFTGVIGVIFTDLIANHLHFFMLMASFSKITQN